MIVMNVLQIKFAMNVKLVLLLLMMKDVKILILTTLYFTDDGNHYYTCSKQINNCLTYQGKIYVQNVNKTKNYAFGSDYHSKLTSPFYAARNKTRSIELIISYI